MDWNHRHPREFRHTAADSFQKIFPEDGYYPLLAAVVRRRATFLRGSDVALSPNRFRAKSTYGAMEGSTLDDWPLTYDELEPFYDKAEYTLGVAGEDGDPFAGKRSRPFPLPPVDLQPGDLLVKKAAQKLGYHPFTVPLGIATQKYQDRNPCVRHPCCNGFICEIGAKSTMVTALLPSTLATGNCQLITEAVVKEVTTDGRGHPMA